MLLIGVGSSYPAGPVEAFALIWILYRIPTISFSLYLFREWQRWRKTFRNGGAPLGSIPFTYALCPSVAFDCSRSS